MAGDWLKVRLDLHDDPAVIAIASAIGLDEDGVVGKLVRLWAWANRQTIDGNAPGVTEMWVDRYVSAPGFAKAMVDAGWLAFENGDGANRRRDFTSHLGTNITRKAPRKGHLRQIELPRPEANVTLA